MRPELNQIQTNILKFYKHNSARFLFLRFDHIEGATRFLANLEKSISFGPDGERTATEPSINICLTYSGLQALAAETKLEIDLNKLESSFVDGPNPTRMGDVKNSGSAESNWWEKQTSTKDIHAVVSIYGSSPHVIKETSERICASASASGTHTVAVRSSHEHLDGQYLPSGRLHFGYVDGISKFQVNWSDNSVTNGEIDFRHFVLGYSNENAPSAPSSAKEAAVFRNSSYVVFRWIYQDVARFEKFLDDLGPAVFPLYPNGVAREMLAAKMMGRFRDGTPLALSPYKEDPALITQDFNYGDDPRGIKCPLTAHIRVVNPRDQPLDAISSGRGVPRIMRRGIPYGPELIGPDDDGIDRGVIGMFICSNISFQFYTLMRWISETSFSPLLSDDHAQDPIMGNRMIAGASDSFTIADEVTKKDIRGLPDFIKTKGTLFLLSPSKELLRRLAGASA